MAAVLAVPGHAAPSLWVSFPPPLPPPTLALRNAKELYAMTFYRMHWNVAGWSASDFP